MRRIRSGLWMAAIVATVAATVFWLPGDPPPEPPRLKASDPVKARAVVAAPPVSELLAPWVPPAPVRRAVAASAPVPSATPQPLVDRSTLKYVGAVLTDNQKRYFFKVNPTGQMLTLIPGQESKGWLLRSVQDQKFQIQGPGGEYEVVR